MKRLLYLSPLLFGTFIVIGLYTANADEITSPGVVVKPLLVVWGITIVVELVVALLVKSWAKSTLITTFLSFCILTYGPITGAETDDKNRYIVPMWIVLAICGSVLLSRSKGTRLDLATKVLFIFLTCTLGIGLYQLGVDSNKYHSYSIQSKVEGIEKQENLPDIYTLVFDRYGSDYSENITKYLDSKGFSTPDQYANYPGTVLELTSLLSMDYTEDWVAGSNKGTIIMTNYLRNDRVGRLAQDLGYTYIWAGPWWSTTGVSHVSDISYSYSKESEFSWKVYQPTLIYPILHWTTGTDFDTFCKEATLYQFDKILEISDMEEPTFTFAHILCPHNPYVFGGTYESGVAYADERIKEIVDTILEKDSNSIIVIMADEAEYFTELVQYWSVNGSFENIAEEPDLVRKKLGILYGVYAPGVSEEQLSVSPVNLFRTIFNSKGWTDLEILSDRYYFPSKQNTYPCYWVDVTECIKGVE